MSETTKKIRVSVQDFKSTYGNNFKFQRVKPSAWLSILDNSVDSGGKRNRVKLYSQILENVVVQPVMKLDDFDNDGFGGFDELEEVIGEALRFQQG